MVRMPRAITKCPNCGAPVTNYALGCPVCGADIAAARDAMAQRRVPMPAVPSLRVGDDSLRLLIALVVALVAPFFGLLLSGFFAWQMHNEGGHTARNLMLAVVVIAALPLLTGYSVWGGRFLFGL
jgi:ABC-type amino acid transport system permease subunit